MHELHGIQLQQTDRSFNVEGESCLAPSDGCRQFFFKVRPPAGMSCLLAWLIEMFNCTVPEALDFCSFYRIALQFRCTWQMDALDALCLIFITIGLTCHFYVLGKTQRRAFFKSAFYRFAVCFLCRHAVVLFPAAHCLVIFLCSFGNKCSKRHRHDGRYSPFICQVSILLWFSIFVFFFLILCVMDCNFFSRPGLQLIFSLKHMTLAKL